jgi:hypothetical protein
MIPTSSFHRSSCSRGRGAVGILQTARYLLSTPSRTGSPQTESSVTASAPILAEPEPVAATDSSKRTSTRAAVIADLTFERRPSEHDGRHPPLTWRLRWRVEVADTGVTGKRGGRGG